MNQSPSVRFIGGPLDGVLSVGTVLNRITYVDCEDPARVHEYLARDSSRTTFTYVTLEDELEEMQDST